jgi:hypothetical protein
VHDRPSDALILELTTDHGEYVVKSALGLLESRCLCSSVPRNLALTSGPMIRCAVWSFEVMHDAALAVPNWPLGPRDEGEEAAVLPNLARMFQGGRRHGPASAPLSASEGTRGVRRARPQTHQISTAHSSCKQDVYSWPLSSSAGPSSQQPGARSVHPRPGPHSGRCPSVNPAAPSRRYLILLWRKSGRVCACGWRGAPLSAASPAVL